MTGFYSGLEGILFIKKEDFDNIQKISGRLYIVDETNGFSLYLGEKPLFADEYLRGKVMTQAEYDTITPDESITYIIKG